MKELCVPLISANTRRNKVLESVRETKKRRPATIPNSRVKEKL